MQNTILFFDEFFIGSSNESHLAVFKEVPEFQSFKGRLELIRVPYILDYEQERKIYEEQIHDGAVGQAHRAAHGVRGGAVGDVDAHAQAAAGEVSRRGSPISSPS